jgi:hypothetical protein
MNRRKLEKHGCQFYHHGGRHDMWINTATLAQAAIPRHKFIKRFTAKGICQQLGVPPAPEL